MRAGRAVVLAGDVPVGYHEAVQMVAALLGATLDRIEREDQRSRELDLGLAMTAHELREPLLGARIALDHVVRGSDTTDHGLLRQTEKELAGLSARIDALLRWSVGSTPLRMVRTDLAQVARDAVRLADRVNSRGRLSLRSPQHVPVRADPIQLRSAIENVVRNAVAYAPSDTPVDVRVYETKLGRPTVTVRDRGPGVPPEERTKIFDPLDPRSVVGIAERQRARPLRGQEDHGRTWGGHLLPRCIGRGRDRLQVEVAGATSRGERMKVMIVDDHVLFAEAIQMAMAEEDFELVGIVNDPALVEGRMEDPRIVPM